MNTNDRPYTLTDFISEECKRDPKFKELWDSGELGRSVGLSLYKARVEANMTQSELSKETGITQGDISRVEAGRANPSLKTLQRLADGLGMKVEITFKPKA